MRIKNLFSLATLVASACTLDPEPLVDETQEIETGDGSTIASQWQRDRAVKLTGAPQQCTATRISARFALTAAHCSPAIGQPVRFYDGGPGTGSGSATITGVANRPGVSGTACLADIDACYDGSGNFSDITLVQLAAVNENDLEGPHATLAWKFPGEGIAGTKVGAGSHDGNANPTHILKQAFDDIGSTDENALFETVDDHTDTGDSGGPFYVSSRIVGVLSGEGYVLFDHFNVYTSVPVHLNWILSTIGYIWRGQPSQANTTYLGDNFQSFFGTELACQYACEKTSSCEAYNHEQSFGLCGLYDNVQGVATQSGWRGALKYGARSGNSNEVVGYRRSDGVNAVVHTAANGRIQELRLQGTWIAGDIHGSAPGVASKLTAYRRGDNTNAVVYRSVGNHTIPTSVNNCVVSIGLVR